jgi:hypothetical protein
MGGSAVDLEVVGAERFHHGQGRLAAGEDDE